MSYTTPATSAAPGSWWLLRPSVLVKQLAPSLIQISTLIAGDCPWGPKEVLSIMVLMLFLVGDTSKPSVRGNWISLDLYPNPLRLGLLQGRKASGLAARWALWAYKRLLWKLHVTPVLLPWLFGINRDSRENQVSFTQTPCPVIFQRQLDMSLTQSAFISIKKDRKQAAHPIRVEELSQI